ncbi:hypothetical protein SASPL_107582 [Salvia splendens]|uniref:Phosphoglucomutase n=1 Tax=Salvia splendens TaxID=180675 RepID=A0A8X8YGF8_SALSN|nr:hypothetical protein SASPL_107582 [Salvia splendens]
MALNSRPTSSLLSRKLSNSAANDPAKSLSFFNRVPLFSNISFNNASLSPLLLVSVKASSPSSTSPSATVAHSQELKIKSVPTQPIEGQKTGTSGLRKKVKEFMQENYLANWIQALFDSLPPEDYKNAVLVLGGDGRYFNKEAAQIIIKIAAGNGVGKILVGNIIADDNEQGVNFVTAGMANGGFIMSASHNPGGPEYDWGIKFNYSSGQPAPESITDKIYGNTLSISEIKVADIPDINLSQLGATNYGPFSVEVIDPVADYLELLEEPYITARFQDSILNGVPLEDFGHGHPDPNLTYAKELVDIMYGENGPDFGAASDGDGDRNMILGKGFFVTPSDSVAIIAANAEMAIPYFKTGPKGLARSMPTSGALDRVAEKLNLPFYEVPTGWKFFGNLMDAGKLSICGEESFGTGSDHIREKDGIWAVLAWLSIIAFRNKDKKPGEKLVSVSDECESEGATKMIDYLRDLISKGKTGDVYGDYTLQFADDFTYTDPVDSSLVTKQGVRFVFTDGSRIIFRLSVCVFSDLELNSALGYSFLHGTGSAGATVRIYIEQFEPDSSKHDVDAQIALKPLIDLALSTSKLKEFTGREQPTVIT